MDGYDSIRDDAPDTRRQEAPAHHSLAFSEKEENDILNFHK